MEWFIAVVVVAALGVAAVAAAGRLGQMNAEPIRDVYRQDLPEDRPLTAADLEAVQFAVTFRGYAMAQVDDLLERLGREIAERDRIIAELRRPPDVGDAVSVRLEVTGHAPAPPSKVWAELIDWEGQRRWIPFTTVRVMTPSRVGLGVRAEALSGFRAGPLPIGLLDRFVVTGWTPPIPGSPAAAELEILHLGPYFTGPGVFRLEPEADGGTLISCTELFDLPGGTVTETLARLALPVMRAGFRHSLAQLAAVAADAARD